MIQYEVRDSNGKTLMSDYDYDRAIGYAVRHTALSCREHVLYATKAGGNETLIAHVLWEDAIRINLDIADRIREAILARE
jgi:hypothetical protein